MPLPNKVRCLEETRHRAEIAANVGARVVRTNGYRFCAVARHGTAPHLEHSWVVGDPEWCGQMVTDSARHGPECWDAGGAKAGDGGRPSGGHLGRLRRPASWPLRLFACAFGPADDLRLWWLFGAAPAVLAAAWGGSSMLNHIGQLFSPTPPRMLTHIELMLNYR